MLYYLIEYLEQLYQPPGFQVIQFLTVRAALAAITALFISMIMGKRIIGWLQRQQLGEQVRTGKDAGAVSHAHKAGTPTMGGIIILMAVLIPTLLWGAITEMYIWLIVLATAWMGVVGFVDDYIKTVKKDKSGLPARIKIIGQVSIGLIVGGVLYFHPQMAEINTLTYLPFIPDETLDYDFFRFWVTDIDLGWVVYIPVCIFIMTAVSNGVNLTDGLDGLASGVTAFVAVGLLGFAYIGGNVIWADFFNEPYLENLGELTVFGAALAAACFGFLWHNGYPAAVFMGDTGALSLGAAVGAMTLMVKKELLLPLLCFVYFLETVSVIIQTSYFKYTRRKTGTGQRVFLMAPIHHHYEKLGIPEPKIVVRFWIVTAITVIAALLMLRIR